MVHVARAAGQVGTAVNRWMFDIDQIDHRAAHTQLHETRIVDAQHDMIDFSKLDLLDIVNQAQVAEISPT